MKRKTAMTALLAVAVAGSGTTVAFTAPGITAPAAPPGRVIYATTGTVVTTVSPSGVVQHTTQVSMNFTASGLVNRVLVQPGQHVTNGQLLASISDPQLQSQVDADSIAVQLADANLAKELAPPAPATLAVARANLAASQHKLAALKAGGTPASIAQARANLDSAQQKLAALQTGSPGSIITAHANLDSAQQKLAALLRGGVAATMTQAQTTLTSAEAKLAALQAGGTPAAIAQAQATLDSARLKLAALQAGGQRRRGDPGAGDPG